MINVSRSLFRGFLVYGGLALIFVLFCLFLMGRGYSLLPGSKLGLFETRIEFVSQEFIRRSPTLHESFDAFEMCMKQHCDPTPILKKRDTIIRAEWPEMFDRLLIEQDWGESSHSQEAFIRFKKAIKRVGGPSVMRNHCVPRIRFYFENGKAFYRHFEEDPSNDYTCVPA